MAAAIVQARMGSSRLPGKTLAPLGPASVLEWVVRRLEMAERIDEIVVATSFRDEDDAIVAACNRLDVTCVRGEADDVLARFGTALSATSAQTIVRVTADCPLIDPRIVDAAVDTLRASGDLDYVSTSLDGRFPRGFDVEVMRREALEAALEEATDPDEREHVTPFIYRRRDRFRVAPVEAPPWARRPDLRLTVDEDVDLDVVREVVDGTSSVGFGASAAQLLEFLDAHPDVARRNADVTHRVVSMDSVGDLRSLWAADRSWSTPLGTIRAIAPSDLEFLRTWRNQQQNVLRQQSPITEEHQRRWYDEVIVPARTLVHPAAILVVVERDGEPTSYGGLTNIEWTSRRAELSFLAATEISADSTRYSAEFINFLRWATWFAFDRLGLRRLFTETWSFRHEHIAILEGFGLQREGLLRDHVEKDGVAFDAVMHGLLATDDRDRESGWDYADSGSGNER